MLKMSVQGPMSYALSQQIRALVDPLLPQIVEYDDYRTVYICVNGWEDTVEQVVELVPHALVIAAWTDDDKIVGWVAKGGALLSSISMPTPTEPDYNEMEDDEEHLHRARIALVMNERLEFCYQTLRQMRSMCRIYD